MMALDDAVAAEVGAYWSARVSGDSEAAWRSLERAHILSQPQLRPHLRVHVLMLGLSVHERDIAEVVGQIVRLLLAPIGALTGRLPWGNTGRSRVSPFRPMPIPDDLAALLPPRGDPR